MKLRRVKIRDVFDYFDVDFSQEHLEPNIDANLQVLLLLIVSVLTQTVARKKVTADRFRCDGQVSVSSTPSNSA